MKTFNVNATSLDVTFDCLDCGAKVEEELTALPEPDMFAEHINDSENCEDEQITCECGREYIAHIYKNQVEGNLEIEDEESGKTIPDANIQIKENY